ncbi:hypothetical protein D3C84_934750 [compost metagenome]
MNEGLQSIVEVGSDYLGMSLLLNDALSHFPHTIWAHGREKLKILRHLQSNCRLWIGEKYLKPITEDRVLLCETRRKRYRRVSRKYTHVPLAPPNTHDIASSDAGYRLKASRSRCSDMTTTSGSPCVPGK